MTTEIYLDDTVAGTSTLLNTTDYVFTPSVNLTGTGRFFLRVFDETLSTTENRIETLDVFAVNNTKEIVVKGQLSEDTLLNLYDIQGRSVLSTQLDHSSISNRVDVSALNGGVYIINIENETQSVIQKIILK